jgi:glycosyltransferase involved in cell wall biosynthesis
LIEGCLEDLVQQTIFAKGEMEILVIDSGSEQQESKIVREFQNKHGQIQYFRTEKRETLYKAWNRAIEKANGEYLTNANTDDRHEPRCIEFLVRSLDESPDCGLCYGNLYRSIVPNEKFGEEDETHSCESQEFFPGSLLLHYPYGAQPLWRRTHHLEIGPFNEEFKALGDYDFALRLAKRGVVSKYVPQAWGKMLRHDGALSTKDFTALQEKKLIIEKYWDAKSVSEIYHPVARAETEKLQNHQDALDEYFLDLGLRALCFYPQFANREPQLDLRLLEFAFSSNTKSPTFANNLFLLDLLLGKKRERSDFLPEWKHDKIRNKNLRFLDGNISEGEFHLYGPTLNFPSETALKGIRESYLMSHGRITDGFSKDRNLYLFCFAKFWKQTLKNIPQEDLHTYEKIYLWGANDKAKIIASWMKAKDLLFSLIDSNPALKGRQTKGISVQSAKFLFSDARAKKVAIILAMGSDHHANLKSIIKIKLSEADVFSI